MAFIFNEDHLRRLCQINSFPVANSELIFFGLRGCLPLNIDNLEFNTKHSLLFIDPDYLHPRCTLGQWLPKEKKIVVFPGSTVPHIRYVKLSKENNGKGANQLMTGYYKDYRKGIHKANSRSGHHAFRQTSAHPVRRTADDFDFDNDDRVEFVNPYDNIHAAWSMGANHEYYASAGCQVVVGYPQCQRRNNSPDIGPWKDFKTNAYNLGQDSFPYMLLSGLDALRVADGKYKWKARLRYGSKGKLVRSLQEVLKDKEYYNGNMDGDFGERTCRAVMEFQEVQFGPHADDGVVGPATASALGIDWPDVE